MNKEIKEILDRLKRIEHKEYSCGFEFADSSTFDEMARCFEERKIMANCITNLQQKIEKLENDKRGMLVQLYKANDEKDKLKEKIKHYEKTQTFGDYVKEVNLLVDYKTRNEKAIEFVNEFIQEDYYEKLDEYITHFTWNTTKEDLLNKLQGVDKDCTD